MELKLAELLTEFCEDIDGGECAVRENYSGRNMFGKATTGIVTNLQPVQILGIVLDNIDEIREKMEDLDIGVGNLKQDSMGLSLIIY